MKTIPSCPGSYGLVLKSVGWAWVVVGSLGECLFRPGLYVYVGSARGAGGLRSRIRRHLQRRKRKRWHIDYLTTHPSFRAVAVCFGASSKQSEGRIVAELCANGLLPYIPRFGSADDPGATTHLLSCPPYWPSCRRALERAFSRRFKAWSILTLRQRRSPAGGSLRFLLLLSHVDEHVGQPAAVSPLVVVPGQCLHQGPPNHVCGQAVDD